MDPSLFRKRAAALHVLPRQEDGYRGGWPLGYIGSQCPTDTPVVCKRENDVEPQGCCPKGQFCQTTFSEVYCCPSAGYFGVKSVEYSGRGLCEVNIDGLSATRIASTITSGTPATTGTATSGGTRQTTSSGGSTGGSSGNTGASSNDSTGSNGGGSVSTGVIAGSVVGGVVLLLLGIAFILWLHRRSLRKDPGPGPAPAPAPAPATTAKEESDFHSPPPKSMDSPGTVYQHQYQHPPQFAHPAVPTPPPPHSVSPAPQYVYAQPPEVEGVARVEMPVYAQELPSSGPINK
ncbi:hypothetical protein OQA88_8013 [Cercophora sp. LCS_1]